MTHKADENQGKMENQGIGKDRGVSSGAGKTWALASDDWLRSVRGTLAASTARFYGDRLGVLRAWAASEGVALGDFRAAHMRAYMEMRALHVSPRSGRPLAVGTRRMDAMGAKVFFRFCAQEGHVPRDPLADYRILKAVQAYVPVPSEAEGARILAATVERWLPAKNPNARLCPPKRRAFFSRRNAALIGGLIQTGARISELLALTLADYQPERGRIVIRESKSKRPREVPLEAAWVGMVNSYLAVRPRRSPTDFLFVTDAGEQMVVNNFRRQWYADLAFAGLPRYTLHSLRHFSLTCLAETNKWAAQQIAGHRDGRTTDVYLSHNQAHLKAVMEQAAPLGRLMVNSRSEKARRKRLV